MIDGHLTCKWQLEGERNCKYDRQDNTIDRVFDIYDYSYFIY